MRRLFRFVLLLLVMVMPNGCIKEMPISVIEVDDPSLIRPEIYFSHSVEDGKVSQSVNAWIYDRYSNSVQLKGGAVLLDGNEMLVKHKDDLPFYSGIETISDIMPGRRYSLAILLSQQKSYEASITTQPKGLTSISVPPRHSRNKDMEISWTEVDSGRALQLELIALSAAEGKNLNTRVIIPLPLGSLASGSYKIPAGFFNIKSGIYKTVILLRNIKSGYIYEGFASGSKIISDISVSRTCEIY